MAKWNMVIDVAKCEDCHSCFLACKDEYLDNDFPPYSVAQPRHGQKWMHIKRKERGQCPMVDIASLPMPCQHCDDAPCIRKSRGGAVYKMDNGIVIIDPEKAKGQPEVVKTCPYGAIWWNEERQVAQKCTLCAHLLGDGWRQTRCVQACPTGALTFVTGDDEQMARRVRDEGLEVLHPEYKTRPRVYYKNLYRFFKCFLGGCVAYEKDGLTECAEGARVTLFRDGEKLAEAVADIYGDFKFDGLDENSGKYLIEVDFAGHAKKTVEVTLANSRNAGTIMV